MPTIQVLMTDSGAIDTGSETGIPESAMESTEEGVSLLLSSVAP